MNSQNRKLSSVYVLFVFLAAIFLSGCVTDFTGSSKNSQISFFDGSAAMRVEVEVYKGPLSKEVPIQFAELTGVVEDSQRALEILYANMTVSAGRLGCVCAKMKNSISDKDKEVLNQPNMMKEKKPQSYNEQSTLQCKPKPKSGIAFHYEAKKIPFRSKGLAYKIWVPKKEDIRDDDKYIFCNTLAQILIDAKTVYSEDPKRLAENIKNQCPTSDHVSGHFKKETINRESRDACLDCLREVSKFGAQLERRASYWATEHVATMPESTRMRIEMANFAQFVKEYGNQINARADALAKQIAGAGGTQIAREQLANSVYLRDSSPTGYLNLYKWNDAAVKRGEITPDVRTRMVEQLVADTYWSKINTVFAAGQGDVSMALIKDDVGNWNLKSFDNSPGELLGAYKNLGLAAVKAATELAGNSSGLPAAKNALNFANQIALGSTSSGRAKETAQRLAALREESARRIRAIGAAQADRKKKLNEKIEQLSTEIGRDDGTTGLRKAKKDAEQELKLANDEIEVAKNKLKSTEQSIVELQRKISENNNELKNLREKRRKLQEQDNARPKPEAGKPLLPPNPELAEIDWQIGKTSEELEKNATDYARLAELKKTQLDALGKAETDVEARKNKLKIVEATLAKKTAERIVIQNTKDNLTKETADQIQQLLELNAALVARMSEAAVEASGQNKLK